MRISVWKNRSMSGPSGKNYINYRTTLDSTGKKFLVTRPNQTGPFLLQLCNTLMKMFNFATHKVFRARRKQDLSQLKIDLVDKVEEGYMTLSFYDNLVISNAIQIPNLHLN